MAFSGYYREFQIRFIIKKLLCKDGGMIEISEGILYWNIGIELAVQIFLYNILFYNLKLNEDMLSPSLNIHL